MSTLIPRSLYEKYAAEYKLDPKVVEAVASVESNHNPFATRFEPAYPYFPDTLPALAHALILSVVSLRNAMATSWGPLQLMGACAYERGFRGYPAELSQTETGIKYACAHMAWLHDVRKCENEQDLIASWNAGSPRKNPDGKYCNQSYVDQVVSVLAHLRAGG